MFVVRFFNFSSWNIFSDLLVTKSVMKAFFTMAGDLCVMSDSHMSPMVGKSLSAIIQEGNSQRILLVSHA